MHLKYFFVGAALCLLSAYPAQAQPRGIDGAALTKVLGVVISVGQSATPTRHQCRCPTSPAT
jgi:hypothetical protein